MLGDQPVSRLCPECGQPMELVRAIPRLGAPPEIFGLYCAPCKTIEVCGHYIPPPHPREGARKAPCGAEPFGLS
jgi:hypothetical protein